MGKASSSKKVSRVARTGGGRTTRRSSGSWGFPAIMGIVVVLGVFGVYFSRDAAHHKAAADQPTVNDHWHAAYGWDICGNFLPDLPQPPNLIGLHTHGDGVIHIEPQDPIQDTGKHATLGRFVSGYPGLELSRTSLTVLNQTWKNGEPKCDGKPGEVVVVSNGKTFTPPNNPSNLRVPKNGWITVAFVPKGTNVPPPPNWQEKVDKANGGAGEHNKPTSSVPNATPTTAPGAPTPTPTTAPGAPTPTPSSAPPTSTPPGPPTTLR